MANHVPGAAPKARCEIDECESDHGPADARLPDGKGGHFWICDECLERMFHSVMRDAKAETRQ